VCRLDVDVLALVCVCVDVDVASVDQLASGVCVCVRGLDCMCVGWGCDCGDGGCLWHVVCMHVSCSTYVWLYVCSLAYLYRRVCIESVFSNNNIIIHTTHIHTRAHVCT
jgi:hypothetical protein